MAKHTLYTNGSVKNQDGHQVGVVLTPQGAKGINGPAFYRNDQIKGGTLLKDGEAAKGILLGRRDLDDVVTEAFG